MTIYVLCPDNDVPSGGIKQLYRHVDTLNRNGIAASIIHQDDGFRCTWFENNTRVSYTSNCRLGESDYLVVSEIYGPAITDIKTGIRKVVYNQNSYLTFRGFSLTKSDLPSPYLHPDVLAALVVSEDSKRYLQYAFSQLKVKRIHHSIDPTLFGYKAMKKQQIAFMPRRNQQDIIQVINILKYRGALQGYELIPIQDRSEAEVAAILKESLIFLSFSRAEGFGLPPAEAMACGCIVVGYHGQGGKEFFDPEFSYPIPQGEVITFAKTVERVLELAASDRSALAKKGETAARFIEKNYSVAREEEDIVTFWTGIIEMDKD